MNHPRKLDVLRSVDVIEDCASTAASDIVPIPLAIAQAISAYVGCPRLDKTAASDVQTAQRHSQSLYQSLFRVSGATYGYCSRLLAKNAVAAVVAVLEHRRVVVKEALELLAKEDVLVDQTISDALRAAVLAAAPKYGCPSAYAEGCKKSPILAAAFKLGRMGRRRADNLAAWLQEHPVPSTPDDCIEGMAAWSRIVDNDAVTWERVIGVQKTGQREDGYDLTVPGYETFMSADGVILSNTMSVHVPILPEAVKDAEEKLLSSRMAFSVRDRDKTMHDPKQEALLGLASAQINPSGVVHKFKNRQEAMEAHGKGLVKLQDEIEIDE
jgi:hypothetical protein